MSDRCSKCGGVDYPAISDITGWTRWIRKHLFRDPKERGKFSEATFTRNILPHVRYTKVGSRKMITGNEIHRFLNENAIEPGGM
jgi:hypothetical protein